MKKLLLTTLVARRTFGISSPRRQRLKRQCVGLLLLLAPLRAAFAQTITFTYKGDTENYTVPAGVTRIQVVATGAAGGRPDANTAYSVGAQVSATLSVTPGEVLFVLVGGQGAGGAVKNAGGYNGGGSGSGNAGGGGGATELRRARTFAATDDYLMARNALVIAGAGGGSDGIGAVGGAGGTPNGGDGIKNNSGIEGGGATQTAAGGNGTLAGTNGQGGNGNLGGGGGGGYYGGGGGAPSQGSAGGGGGSSWVTGIGSSDISYSQSPVAGGNGSLTLVLMDPPLPVQFRDFTAQAQGAAVALAWHTATEVNSDRFEVERSLDGDTFQRLATIAAAGTTYQARAYSYRDALLPAGASLLYYRLRQVDRDGTAAYSPVRTVAVAPVALSLYPNPAARVATLRGAQAGALVQVYNALGRLVLYTQADVAGMAALELPAGLYLVRSGPSQALRLRME